LLICLILQDGAPDAWRRRARRYARHASEELQTVLHIVAYTGYHTVAFIYAATMLLMRRYAAVIRADSATMPDAARCCALPYTLLMLLPLLYFDADYAPLLSPLFAAAAASAMPLLLPCLIDAAAAMLMLLMSICHAVAATPLLPATLLMPCRCRRYADGAMLAACRCYAAATS